MKQTYQWFCNSVIWRSREHGLLNDDVLIESCRDAFMSFANYKDEDKEKQRALRKAQRLLRRPDIKARIAEVYRIRGFSIVDALDQHISHIQGTPMVLRDKTGNIVYDKESGEPVVVYCDPNYQALKDYLKMVLPHAPTSINLKHSIEQPTAPPIGESAGVLAMRPRALSAKVDDVG